MSTADEAGERRRGTRPGVLTWVALAIAVLALFLAVFRDPFGPVYQMSWNAFSNGLDRYDFSSPAEALKSRLTMEYSRDFRAAMAYSRQMDGAELKEHIDTLEVKKEEDVKLPRKKTRRNIAAPAKDKAKVEDKKQEKTRTVRLLFVSYKVRGEPTYKVEAYEKRDDSGYWRNTYVSSYDVEDVNKSLAKEMREWEAKGG
jgi:hypothetical protein